MEKFFLMGDVNNSTMGALSEALISVKDGNTFTLIISSGGGSIFSMATAIDVMKDMRKKNMRIITIASGRACSCAAILAAFGDERIVTPGTRFLIHGASKEYSGSAKINEALAKKTLRELRGLNKYFEDLLCDKTRLPRKLVQRKLASGEDWVLTPEELEKYIVTRPADGWTELLK